MYDIWITFWVLVAIFADFLVICNYYVAIFDDRYEEEADEEGWFANYLKEGLVEAFRF